MSEQPDIEDAHKVMCARRSPEGVDVEAGKYYWWCACGRSKTQPFCDGSHTALKFRDEVDLAARGLLPPVPTA